VNVFSRPFFLFFGSKEGKPRRLIFLNPRICSVDQYLERLSKSEVKDPIDILGFNCSFKYQVDEQAFRNSQNNIMTQRDIEWVQYLKSIGGIENLKPGGIFKPSKDLKNFVRRGVPVAYRSVVWQKISLSSLLRAKYPVNYYATLLSRIPLDLNRKVKNDIEKDVDRYMYTIFFRFVHHFREERFQNIHIFNRLEKVNQLCVEFFRHSLYTILKLDIASHSTLLLG
jgi:hypothetical protein